MRISFFSHYSKLYGANRSLLNLIQGLKHYEVDSFVFAPKAGPFTQALDQEQVPFKIQPLPYWVSPQPQVRRTVRRLIQNIILLPRIRRQVSEWKIDILYTNSIVIPTGQFAAWYSRKPHVWHIREFIDLHYGYQPDAGKAIFQNVINQADAKIAISHALHDHVLKTTKNSHVIYNGIAFQRDFDLLYQQASSRTAGTGAYTFGILGLIALSKGQEEAIHAFALVHERFPETHLLIVGHGKNTDVERCKQLVRNYKLEQAVEFLGYLDDPYQAYQQMDCLLMCSKMEAMGRVTVEAMSACLPVIGHNSGGTKELIQPGVTGLLYEHGPEELAQQMALLVQDTELSHRLGMQGWETARENYSIETYARQVYSVLQCVYQNVN